MCGRYSFHLADLSRIQVDLGPTRSGIEHWEPRFNAAPTQAMPVVIHGRRRHDPDQVATRHLLRMAWGFAPAGHTGPQPINARSETAAQKPLFRAAFARRRCVVPATGYFEWPAEAPPKGQPKQPHWIHPLDEVQAPLLYMAGIWTPLPDGGESTTASATGSDRVYGSFAILTREAVGAPQAVHHRMPVFLTPAQAQTWLPQGPLPEGFFAALCQAPTMGDQLQVRRVDPQVNRAHWDDPNCLAQAKPVRQLGLF